MDGKKAQAPRLISYSRLASWYVFVLAFLYFFHFSFLGEYTSHHIAQKIQFMTREWLGATPPLHPRIKIYAHDDRAVHEFKRADISLSMWGTIVETISRSGPSMIIIDKKFGVINDQSEADQFIEKLNTSAPVLVGGFTLAKGINDLFFAESLLNESRKEYDLSLLTDNNLEKADWLDILDHHGYGPNRKFSDLFFRVGHINYDFFGKIEPFRRLTKDIIIPHLTLLTADKLKIEHRKLKVDDYPVYLDRENHVIVNFPAKKDLLSNTLSIYPVVAKGLKGLKLNLVKKDDIVIILPLFFTGNADMGATPIGDIPRGYIIVSLINSVLTKNWLRPVNFDELFIWGATTLGAAIGLYFGPVSFWVILTSLCLFLFALAMALFSYLGIVTPWFMIMLSTMLGGVVFFSVKMSRQSKISKAYEIALSGLVSRKSLKELVKNPAAISRDASEQLLTIMFLDMVSFSNMAENEHPKVIFDRLKDLLGHFSLKVHEYGGVVDKTLGDGMLCFFGYNYIGGKTSKNHADQAISCAEAIQREHVVRSLNKLRLGEPMVPLRIGINSAKVYIGDLGNQERIDFTLIGDGVNFAQRLEAACEPFHIMLSEDCLSLSSKYHVDSSGMQSRKIKIKHHDRLFQVFQFQPFFTNHQLLEEAQKAFQEKYEKKGRAPRWPLENPEKIKILSSHGDGYLRNFSHTGFAITMSTMLHPGDSLRIDQLIHNVGQSEMQESVADHKLFPIQCEVRWTAKESNIYVYGLKFVHLPEAEKDILYESLKDLVLKIS